MKRISAKSISLCALMMAMCYVATAFVSIPGFTGKGYINAGDVVIIVSAYILGVKYSVISSSVGSTLADITLGYTLYAPCTFVVKFLMAFFASLIFKSARKCIGTKKYYLFICLGAFVSELIMTAGYFLYEYILYGYSAIYGLAGNFSQGFLGVVGSFVIIMIIKNNKILSKIK